MLKSLYLPICCRNLICLTLSSDSWCRVPVRTFFLLPKRLQVSRKVIYDGVNLLNECQVPLLLSHEVT